MIALKQYLTMVAVLLMIALTAFTVQAILDPLVYEPVSGTPITGNVVDVPENDNNDDLVGIMNRAADWLLQGNQ